MLVLHVLLAGATVATLLPVTMLFAEVVLAVTGRRTATADATERPALAVIMPARNEEAIIAATLRALIPQLRESDRVIVVADNCSDGTAALAAAEGAQVIVRNDPLRRGKGYALDYAVRQLAAAPPEIIVVLDADCRIESGSLALLAAACKRARRPVQARYLMQTPPHAGVLMRIAAFAWIVKTYVRPLGMHRLGLPCQLMGTGMAFPWSCISTVRLATALTADDLKLGIDLAVAGTAPLFCPQASVRSSFPESNEGLHGQRLRWEHGHLDVALQHGPRLLARAIATRNIALLALGLDLCVPPLALLLLLVAALWCGSALVFLASGAWLALALGTVAILLLLVSVLLARNRYARRVISLRDLAWAGVYALWKIPLYARFLRTRQSDWVASKRD
jgi:cellulose synthase/poly-beta-1,6-N-acetylglucosamine synthase-like glycosyltransferase